MADDIGDDDVAGLGRALDRFRFALLIRPGARAPCRHPRRAPAATSFSRPSAPKSGCRHFRQDLQRHRVFEIGALCGSTPVRTAAAAPGADCARESPRPSCPGPRSPSTSPRTAGPYRLRNSGSGTLPGRKPGMRTIRPISPSRLGDLLLDLARRDRDLELALQPLGAGLGHIHRRVLTFLASIWRWCGRGFEPPVFSSLEPNPVRLPVWPPRPAPSAVAPAHPDAARPAAAR